MATTKIDPVEFDTALAALYGEQHELAARHAALLNKVHYVPGDKKTGQYGRRVWGKTNEAVIEILKTERRGHDVLAELETVEMAHSAKCMEIAGQNAIYAKAPWSRFILCLSNGGHIHNAVGCSTLRYNTPREWRPELSGASVAKAVKVLGEALCSVCFPGAPVAFRAKNLTQVAKERTRGDRDTAKAAKLEAKYVKALRPAEVFRVDGDRIATVAACKDVIRKEVEFRDYLGHGKHPSWDAYRVGAEQAKKILLARDADHGGMTEAEICTLIERAVVRNRKDGARI